LEVHHGLLGSTANADISRQAASNQSRMRQRPQRKGIHLVFTVHQNPPAPPRDRLLRLPDVERIAGVKKSTVYQLMRQGQFPKCVRITRRLSAWPESAVLNWVQARIAEGGAQ
jgi:prophage regulatory protein